MPWNFKRGPIQTCATNYVWWLLGLLGVKMLLQSWMTEAYPLNASSIYFLLKKNGQQRPCLRDQPFAKLTELQSSLQHHQVPFFTPFGLGFRGQCCYHTDHTETHRDLGPATLRNPASRQDLKNGRLLLGRFSPSWLMEWGSWIRRNDNWNRTLMKQMIFQYIS